MGDSARIYAVPIDVDNSQAPALLRFRVLDPFPSREEITGVRERLISAGDMNASTVSLIDVRELTQPPTDFAFMGAVGAVLLDGGWPRRRAILMNPGKHLRYMQMFQSIAPSSIAIAGFLDEREALEWLLNPEGRAGFRP
jgi:hypothetical protein